MDILPISANISEHKMREVRKRMTNQKFASEKNIRKYESLSEIKYDVTEIPMEFKANASKCWQNFNDPFHTSLFSW